MFECSNESSWLGTETVTYFRLRQMHPRIAVVGKPPTADGFAVVAAKNRWVVVEMFWHREQALSWLAVQR